jgi:hypothetical protein
MHSCACRLPVRSALLSLLALPLVAMAFASSASAQAAATRFADVNGTRIHYLAVGKGEPIILLHGYAQTSHM